MPWNDYPLTELVIPQTAGDADPRIVIGPDVPPELLAYYAAQGLEAVGAVLYYTTADVYFYEVDLAFPGGVGPHYFHSRGSAQGGTVFEYEFMFLDTDVNVNVNQIGDANPVHVTFGNPGGIPRSFEEIVIASSQTLTVAGDMTWGNSRTLSAEVDPTGTSTSNTYVSTLTGAGAVPVTLDFYAPPSGQVTVSWRATGQVSASFGAVSPQINLGGGGAVAVAATDNRAIQFNSTVQMGFGASSLITGLTPNTLYTATLFHRCAAASTFTLLRRELVVTPAL